MRCLQGFCSWQGRRNLHLVEEIGQGARRIFGRINCLELVAGDGSLTRVPGGLLGEIGGDGTTLHDLLVPG